MGTLDILKVAMANPQRRANANKGILSLGIRLSGSHLHSTRRTNSTSLIIRIGGVLLHPGSQPGTGRPAGAGSYDTACYRVTSQMNASPSLVRIWFNGDLHLCVNGLHTVLRYTISSGSRLVIFCVVYQLFSAVTCQITLASRLLLCSPTYSLMGMYHFPLYPKI